MPHTEILRDGGRRKAQAGLWRAAGATAIALAVFLATGALAEAAQRIHFKNGHVLVVENVREQGDVVYLQLTDGSEVGFPKSLIAEVEKGPKIRRPRTSGPRNLSRSQRGPDPRSSGFGQQRALNKGESRFGQEIAKDGNGAVGDRPETIGYSKFGAGYRSSQGTGNRGPHISDLRNRQRGRIGGTPGAAAPGGALAPTAGGSLFGPPKKAKRESKQQKAAR